MEVAHHGARHNRRRARPKPLSKAAADHPVDRGREGAGNAGQEIERKPAQHHRPPAETVRERPVGELREGEAEQEGADHELGRRDLGAEARGDARQGR